MRSTDEEVDQATLTEQNQECQRECDDALESVNRPRGHILSEMVGEQAS